MMIDCVIIDDEPLARKILVEYLDELPDFQLVAACQDAMEAQQILNNSRVDLLFLDIAMPKLTGMQFIKSLASPPLVIFTTAYSEYAVEAFEVNAFDYLVKPITLERFLVSIEKVRKFLSPSERVSGDNKWINIKEGRRIYHIDTDDILYLQAYGDYVRMFLKDQTLMPKEKLNVIKELLPDKFLQVHRSYIINLSEVKFMEGNLVQVASHKIPVSDTYRNHLLQVLNQ
ncbi:MAG: response regulator transcription factor [Saprospiraceae bacterium]|nr:response regulator transcription factor [Saprospiraceae bacterium]